MKKVRMLLVAMITIAFMSCEGPQGPQGNDGGLIVSQSFEIELDFNAANNYQYIEPYGFQVLSSDVTLVYILWETINGQDIWRLVPQNVIFQEGILTYNYDFTQDDVRFFLDGTINFNSLNPSYTQNQVFRVVVIPADNVGRLNYNDLSVVMDAYGITTFNKR